MHKSKHSKFQTYQANKEDSELFKSSIDNVDIFDKDEIIHNDSNRSYKFPKHLNYHIINHAEFSASEALFFNIGIRKNIIQKIKQGNVPLSSSVDLHGLTLSEACITLANFIYQNQKAAYLHIIHGKGYNSNMFSTLKTQTYHYLKSHPQVVTICSAPQHLGGTGAIIIKLKHA